MGPYRFVRVGSFFIWVLGTVRLSRYPRRRREDEWGGPPRVIVISSVYGLLPDPPVLERDLTRTTTPRTGTTVGLGRAGRGLLVRVTERVRPSVKLGKSGSRRPDRKGRGDKERRRTFT